MSLPLPRSPAQPPSSPARRPDRRGDRAPSSPSRGHNLVLVARRLDRLEALATEIASEFDVAAHAIACDLADADARGAAARPARGARPRCRDPRQQRGVRDRWRRSTSRTPAASCSRSGSTSRPSSGSPPSSSLRWSPAAAARSSTSPPPRGCNRSRSPPATSAAKAYVLTFSEALHTELRGHGVTVTALAPGPVSTDFWEVANWKVTGQSFEHTVPRHVWITAEHAAQAGVRGLDSGARVIVPGLPIRAAMLASRYIPNALKLPSIALAMRRR